MPSKKYVKSEGGVNLRVRFTDKPITGWGGLVVMSKWFAKIGVAKVAEEIFGAFEPGSNRGYKPWELIVSFMAAIYMGANRVAHVDLLRHDAPVRAMFALARVPSASSLLRFFRKFNLKHVSVLMPEWNRRMMERARDRFSAGGETLDLDSSVFERYGGQEGSKKGYNPRKPGRPSQSSDLRRGGRRKMGVALVASRRRHGERQPRRGFHTRNPEQQTAVAEHRRCAGRQRILQRQSVRFP